MIEMETLPPENCRTVKAETLIGLLRHGITQWNKEKRIQGSLDSPLSAHGRRTTARWAGELQQYGWDRIIASDLGRVRETVAILNETLHVPVHFDARLRELNWGDWEGLPMHELQQEHGALLEKMVKKGWDFRPPAGESRREGWERAQAALLENVADRPGERILVVCHMGIIKCCISSITGSSYLPGDTPAIGKEALHLLIYAGNRLGCRQLNITLPVNG